MKLFCSALLILTVLSFSQKADAQQVTLGTQFTSIPLSDTLISVPIRSTGAVTGDLFRIKLWVSFDAQIGDDDLVETSDVFDGDGYVGTTRKGPVNFRLPLPDDTRDLPRLVGDTLSPIEWIGRNMYFRVCIVSESGAELDCNSSSGVGVPLVVTPPNIMSGVGSLAVPFASKGESNDYIDLVWPVPTTDNGNLLINRYVLSQIVPNGDVTKLDFSINDLEVFTNSQNRQFYRKRLTQVTPGVLYYYGTAATVCLDDLCSRRFPSGVARFDAGNAYVNIVASTNLNGRIEFDWEPFTPNTLDYTIQRCELGQTDDQCIQLANIEATDFTDTNVERGKRYVYTVEACESRPPNASPPSCFSNSLFKVAVTSPGESGLVDEFEDDDNAEQATLVEGSVSQLHSFDTPVDEDWIKLVITRAQSVVIRTSGETSEDTKITLYSSDVLDDPSNLNAYEITVATNTPDTIFASYATLITDELEPGDYFFKVEQESIPGLPVQNVFNYTLDVEFKNSMAIVPIINLLLDD